jgi:hypothetical protein
VEEVDGRVSEATGERQRAGREKDLRSCKERVEPSPLPRFRRRGALAISCLRTEESAAVHFG